MEVFLFVAILVIAFVVGKIKEASRNAGEKPAYNARLQQLIETFQGQQSGSLPPPVQGQFTQPSGGAGYSPPMYSQPAQVSPSMAPAQDSAQIAGMHNQLVQQVPSPRDRRRAAVAGPQMPGGPGQVVYNAGPAQWVPNQLYPVQSAPPQYQQPYYPQAPVPRQPTPRNDTDQRVRELMEAGNVIAAVRLLSDEQEMGILEAQQYAQSLVAPQSGAAPVEPLVEVDDSATTTGSAAIRGNDGEPYVGSAAFAESLFEPSHDDGTWASGWTEPAPDPADRADIDELWQTVRTPPGPQT